MFKGYLVHSGGPLQRPHHDPEEEWVQPQAPALNPHALDTSPFMVWLPKEWSPGKGHGAPHPRKAPLSAPSAGGPWPGSHCLMWPLASQARPRLPAVTQDTLCKLSLGEGAAGQEQKAGFQPWRDQRERESSLGKADWRAERPGSQGARRQEEEGKEARLRPGAAAETKRGREADRGKKGRLLCSLGWGTQGLFIHRAARPPSTSPNLQCSSSSPPPPPSSTTHSVSPSLTHRPQPSAWTRLRSLLAGQDSPASPRDAARGNLLPPTRWSAWRCSVTQKGAQAC